MSKYNLGIVKTSILTNLNEGSSVKGFINLLKESDLLKTVLTVFDNIEKKHIPNEDLAIKYIDENINLLKEKGFTKEQFAKENLKLFPLVEGVAFAATDKQTLYSNIHTLIYESLQGKKSTNVNKLHDAFVYVMEHIKTNEKKVVVEPLKFTVPEDAMNEFVLKRAIRDFNEKYSEVLSEHETLVFKSMITENVDLKRNTFNQIKESALAVLSEIKNQMQGQKNLDVSQQREIDQYTSKINESINRVILLEYKDVSFNQDILSLVDLLGD